MRQPTKYSILPTTGVSPVVGASLMLALAVLFTTLIGGVILSQYNTPEDPPQADGDFSQSVQDNIEYTSNVRYTLIESYNSNTVTLTHQNTSKQLHDNTTTPYLAYQSTDPAKCSQSDKPIGNGITVTQNGETYNNINKSYCILTPDDDGYNPDNAITKKSGDTLYICGLKNKATIQVIAENDREQQVISTYTVHYQTITQYSVSNQYDNPCNNNNS